MPDSPVLGGAATGALPQSSYAWAFHAYDAFVQSLSPEVRQHLGEHREASYTVAFGKTQMGKSTLILNLLGLSSEAVRHVSAVLRGGRAGGNSSTAIPTEYRRGRDECWRIVWGSRVHECIGDADAMAAFAEVRDMMERNEVSDDLVLCVVEIPERYFDAERALLCGTRILDLPGADAANPIERQFVTRVAESLVPNADMILLVGRADDLSFLRPDHLNLPGLSDWQLNPRRFRVVTTFSFTPESIRTFSRDTDCWGNENAYRQRLIGQIERFGPLDPEARAPELYFPLEFGETWESAQDLQATQLAPMMDRLMQRLRQEIATANSPLGRLEGAIAVHGVVARVHAARLQAMRENEKRLEKIYTNRRQDIDELVSVHNKKKVILDSLSRVIPSDSEIIKGSKFISDWYVKAASTACNHRLPQIEGEGITRGMFQSAIVAMCDDLKKLIVSVPELMTEGTMPKSEAFWKRTLKTYSSSASANNVDAMPDPFSALNDRLKGYWLDAYWFTGNDSQYSCDRREFVMASDKLAAYFASNLNYQITQCAFDVQKELREEERFVDAQASNIEQQIHEHQFSCERIQHDINAAITQREKVEISIQEEQDRSQKFARLLSSAYNRSLESTYRGVLNAPDAVSAFKHLVLGSTFRATRESVGARMIGKVQHEHI